MNEDVMNMSLRKFLKKVGVTSQREIETSIREAVAAGRLQGSERLPVSVRLVMPKLAVDTVIEGEIELE
jgi:hypothetical protein